MKTPKPVAEIPSEPAVSPPETVRIILDRSGVQAVGAYLAGQEYDLPAAEAQRLIDLKGFRRVNPKSET